MDRFSIEHFLKRWYENKVTISDRVKGDLRVPWALNDWYMLAGGNLQTFSNYYNFMSKEHLQVVNGLVVFCSGPAEDPYLWAYSAAGEDPPTFEFYREEIGRPTGLKLSEMILYIAVSSAVLGPKYGLVNTASPERNYLKAIERLVPLPGRLWSWPDDNLHFYYGPDLLAQAGQQGGPFGNQILVGAANSKALSLFDGLEWEWDSRSDE